MRITSVELRNWRNFKRAKVYLRDRAFLIGPNAAGKSNFLDALLFLRQVATQGLGEAVHTRGGISKIRSLHARRDPEVFIRIEIGDSPDSPMWAYEIVIGQDNQRQPIVRSERAFSGSTQVLDRPDRNDAEDRLLLSQTHLEQVTQNHSFRPVAEFLSSITYLHLVPQIIRAPRTQSSRRNDPYGSDFLERVSLAQKRIRDARLGRINKALKVAVPQLQGLSFIRDEADGTPHLEATFSHWRQNAGRQRESEFSDGTLRLIGLLWAIQDGDGPVVLEEPELSLNTAIVRQLPRLFRRIARLSKSAPRQLIITTHSYDLLTDPGIDPSEVLVLTPEHEGTALTAASDVQAIRDLVEGGIPVAEAALPYAEPRNVFQLTLL